MTVRFFTAQSLGAELDIPAMRVWRGVHRHLIVPDGIAGRSLLFKASRLPGLRKQLGIPLAA